MKRRRTALLVIMVVAVAAVVSALTIVHLRQESARGNDAVPGTGEESSPWPTVTPTAPGTSDRPAFVSAVSASKRTFVDQSGSPILVRGDSPWALMTDLSLAQMGSYYEARASQGFNAAIVSLLGASGNGGPSDDGSTFDGVMPFVAGDVTRLNDAYWSRVHASIALAARSGITVFAYPIDAWVIGKAFVPSDQTACQTYGTLVARRLADLPNIVWMAGGDYLPDSSNASGSDVDRCIDGMVRGIRSTGDDRPFSVQIGYDGAFVTSGNVFWGARVDWNFVYTYYPTYAAVETAYRSTPTRPALLGEANYEGENNQPDSPATTKETLRRQVLWSLTSGAAGQFFGTSDWHFSSGWEDRLHSPGAQEVGRLGLWYSALPAWQDLAPDLTGSFLVGGRGTPVAMTQRLDVLQSDYATASITPSGRLAVVYVPTARTFSIDTSKLAPGVAAAWVDPASGARTPAKVTTTYTTPGANADGDHDWLLVFQR